MGAVVWRLLKCEDVYLEGYTDDREAKAGISDWILFYAREVTAASSCVSSKWRSAQLWPIKRKVSAIWQMLVHGVAAMRSSFL